MLVAYVALGGAAGSVLRYLVSGVVGAWLGKEFPYGTLTVNIIGGLLMGLLVGAMARWLPAEHGHELRALLAVGVLGGFTTFSAFSLDVVTLAERGAYGAVAAYIMASVLVSVLALLVGLWVMRAA